MDFTIDNPAKEFKQHYERHKVNVEEYFDALVNKSQIDLSENNKTCDNLYKHQRDLANARRLLNSLN